jgi:prolipoprotein diacylglyceryl transferase
VLTHPDDYFGPGKDLLKTLYIWEGGLAIFGGLVLGAVGALIGCRLSGVRFWSFADALAPGLLLAQAFGRLGNWFNHELFGVPTTLPWGLQIEKTNPAFPVGLPAGTLFLPTFLYEIIWNLVGIAVILFLEKKFTLQWGKVIALYLIWYGLGRSYLESVRIDPSEIFLGVRTNVWAAWGAIIVGLIIFFVQRRRHPGLEPSVYLPGREWTPQAAVHSEETYSEFDEDDNDADPHQTSDPAGVSAVKPVTSGAGTKS